MKYMYLPWNSGTWFCKNGQVRVIVKLSQQPAIFPSENTRTSGLVTERFHLSHSEDIFFHGCMVRYMRITNALDHTSRGVYIVHDLMWSNDDRFYLPHDTKEFISLRDVVRKCSGTCPVMSTVVRRIGELGCLYLSTPSYWSTKNSGKWTFSPS